MRDHVYQLAFINACGDFQRWKAAIKPAAKHSKHLWKCQCWADQKPPPNPVVRSSMLSFIFISSYRIPLIKTNRSQFLTILLVENLMASLQMNSSCTSLSNSINYLKHYSLRRHSGKLLNKNYLIWKGRFRPTKISTKFFKLRGLLKKMKPSRSS
jgi:hypothetical protein